MDGVTALGGDPGVAGEGAAQDVAAARIFQVTQQVEDNQGALATQADALLDVGTGEPAKNRAKLTVVLAYMDEQVQSGEWRELWDLQADDRNRFKKIYPDDDRLQILVNIAQSADGLAGVKDVLRDQRLEKFVPVAHEIMAVAQRPGGNGSKVQSGHKSADKHRDLNDLAHNKESAKISPSDRTAPGMGSNKTLMKLSPLGDPDAVVDDKDLSAKTWAVDRKTRNRAIHAANGNMSAPPTPASSGESPTQGTPPGKKQKSEDEIHNTFRAWMNDQLPRWGHEDLDDEEKVSEKMLNKMLNVRFQNSPVLRGLYEMAPNPTDPLENVKSVLNDKVSRQVANVADEIMQKLRELFATGPPSFEEVLDKEITGIAKFNPVQWNGNVPQLRQAYGWSTAEGLALPTMGDPTAYLQEVQSLVDGAHASIKGVSGSGKSKRLAILAEAGQWVVPTQLCGSAGGATVYWEVVIRAVKHIMMEGASSRDQDGIPPNLWSQRVALAKSIFKCAIQLPLFVAWKEMQRMQQRDLPNSKWQAGRAPRGYNKRRWITQEASVYKERISTYRDSPPPQLQLYLKFISTFVYRRLGNVFENLVGMGLPPDDQQHRINRLLEHTLPNFPQRVYFGFDEASAANALFQKVLPCSTWHERESAHVARQLTLLYGPGLTYHVRRALLDTVGSSPIVCLFVGCSDPFVHYDSDYLVSGGAVYANVDSVVPSKNVRRPANASITKMSTRQICLTVPVSRDLRLVLSMVFKGSWKQSWSATIRPRFFIDFYLLNPSVTDAQEEAKTRLLELMCQQRDVSYTVASHYFLNHAPEDSVKKDAIDAGILGDEDFDGNSIRHNELMDDVCESFLQMSPVSKWAEDMRQYFMRQGTKGDLAEVYMVSLLREMCLHGRSVHYLAGHWSQTKIATLQNEEVKLKRSRRVEHPETQTETDCINRPHQQHGADAHWRTKATHFYVQLKVRESVCHVWEALASLLLPWMTNHQRGQVASGNNPDVYDRRNQGMAKRRAVWEANRPARRVDIVFSPHPVPQQVVTVFNEHNFTHPEAQVHAFYFKSPSGIEADLQSVSQMFTIGEDGLQKIKTMLEFDQVWNQESCTWSSLTDSSSSSSSSSDSSSDSSCDA